MMEPRLGQINRICNNLALLWAENPDMRFCDLLRQVSTGPFEGVDDSNLDAWVIDLLTGGAAR